jgi:AraC family transcriptional regulator
MKRETQSFYEAAVERTVRHIAAALDEALDLGELARQAALSPFHFHRIFRGMVGETPLEMHRRLRLERPAWQLSSIDTGVTTVAFDAGYETHEAFSRAFRQAYGRSPTAFREDAARGRSDCARAPRIELAARSGVHFDPVTTVPVIRFHKGESSMNVKLEQMPELRVATVRHVGPYDRISEAFQRLGAIVGPAGLLQKGSAMIAIYHDDPEATPVDALRSDAGVTVPEGSPLPDGIVEQRLPAGRYARTTHVGPYTQLGGAWSRFMGEWLPKSGERLGSGASYEVYRNNPTNAPPEALRTDLFLPLA